MRTLAAILLIFASGLNLKAQQDPLFNKYMFNPLIINPAYAGSREALSMVLLNRTQWLGFDGAPLTQTFSIHAPLNGKKIGVGLSIMRDEIGPTTNTGIMGIFAYRMKLGQGKLSFGLRGAAYHYHFDWNKVTYKDQEIHPLLANSNYWLPSFDFGLRYHDRTLYLGLAFSHLNRPSIGDSKDGSLSINGVTYGQKIVPHLAATAGYALELSDRLVFKPSVLLKSSSVFESSSALISSVDINASVLIDRTLWFGASYRTKFGLVGMVQYDVTHRLSCGLSYDFALTKFRKSNSGSAEFFIRFDIPFRKSKVLSPRYF